SACTSSGGPSGGAGGTSTAPPRGSVPCTHAAGGPPSPPLSLGWRTRAGLPAHARSCRGSRAPPPPRAVMGSPDSPPPGPRHPPRRGAGPGPAQPGGGLPVDPRQQVVDLVGPAPRQGADALHLLRLQQLPLQLLALGDVALDGDEVSQPALRVDDRRGRH